MKTLKETFVLEKDVPFIEPFKQWIEWKYNGTEYFTVEPAETEGCKYITTSKKVKYKWLMLMEILTFKRVNEWKQKRVYESF